MDDKSCKSMHPGREGGGREGEKCSQECPRPRRFSSLDHHGGDGGGKRPEEGEQPRLRPPPPHHDGGEHEDTENAKDAHPHIAQCAPDRSAAEGAQEQHAFRVPPDVTLLPAARTQVMDWVLRESPDWE